MKDLLRPGAQCCSPGWKMVHRDPVQVHLHTHLGFCHCRWHAVPAVPKGSIMEQLTYCSSVFFLEGSYSLLISIDQRLVPVVYLSQWNKYISISGMLFISLPFFLYGSIIGHSWQLPAFQDFLLK